MAGIMGCSLLFVIILLISTVSGVIEISFEKGVPRLNNSLYCDYYFACHTEGETLQWRVGNNVFNYFGNSTIGSVFNGSASNCNYTATLLSLKPLSSSRSFTSALILTCQSNFNMSINCSDGSSVETISIPEKELSLMAENTNSLIYLEHVLSQNLVNADNSTCTNVFVCGVNHSFMNVKLGNTVFFFTEFDFIGREHNEIQGTSVQQAILIDKKPYNLVVAMFIVGSEVMNVTCGFPQNIIFLSGMQCHPVTTMPETTGTMESESTSMESESSTEGESTTMASGGSSTLSLILGLIIASGVLVAIIIIFIVLGYIKIRNRKRNQQVHEEFFLEEKPLKENNFDGIKKPKPMKENTNYSSFREQVQFIFINMNQNEFNAATTYITAPDVEGGGDIMTELDDHIYIGMLEGHPVGLVRDETGENCGEMLTSAIKDYFPNAKYILNVGVCYSFDSDKTHLADVLISKEIFGATIQENGDYSINQEKMSVTIKWLFCKDPQKVTGLEVAKGREAKHYAVKFGSSVSIIKNKTITSILQNVDGICGCDKVGEQLMNLQKNGIKMPDESKKDVQVIIINGVTGFKDDNKGRVWDFIAAQAAFHYVATKLIAHQISKEKPRKENRSVEIKKPKPKKENTDYYSFCERVRFIFINMNQNVFNAATTYITAPDVEDGGDIMTQLDDHIYIGMLEGHPVGLVRDETGENCEEMLTSAIKDYFSNAKYILNVAVCYSFDPAGTNFADVLVSNKIIGAIAQNEGQNIASIEMSSEIKRSFCSNPNEVDGLEVAVGGRRAKHLVVAFGSSVDIKQNEDIVNILESFDEICGIDMVGRQLLNLQRNGIKIADNSSREVEIAIINGVTGSLYYNMDRAWDFIAAQAAFHYTAKKLKNYFPL